MKRRLLLIGVDSMDPDVYRLLEGSLPNFRRLSFSPLRTTIPPETPVAWSAAATGCNPGGYGIFDFLTRDPASYQLRLNLAREKPGILKSTYECAMKGVPFWRRLTAAGIHSTVVRWPVTFPAEKIKGRMLSGLGVVDIRGMLGGYSFFSTDPADREGEGGERVTTLEFHDGVARAELPGPFVRRRGELRSVGLAMEIDRRDAGGVGLTLGGQRTRLEVGRWSEFLPAVFKPMPFVEVRGMVAFRLLSLEPHLRLYAGTVQIDPSAPFLPISQPESYAAELAQAIGSYHTLGMPEETKGVTEGRLDRGALAEQIDRIETEREAMLRLELGRFTDGVLAVVFDAGDRLQHIFWEQGLKRRGVVPGPIAEYYRRMDRIVGEALEAAGRDTPAIVMSDHGFTDFRRQVNVNSWLAANGYLVGAAPGNNLFGGVEWARSRAYAVGFTSLFLNLKGREGQGAVEPRERDALERELAAKLLAWKDADGAPVLASVSSGREVYRGPHADAAPDLVLGFSEGYRMAWRSAAGGLDAEAIFDNTGPWQGDHLVDRRFVPGVLFSNFPIRQPDPELPDIAPTVLALAGAPASPEIEGRALAG